MLTILFERERETRQSSAAMFEDWISARPKGPKRREVYRAHPTPTSRLQPDSWNPLDEVVSFYDYPLASAVGTNIKEWFDTCFWLSSCIRILFYLFLLHNINIIGIQALDRKVKKTLAGWKLQKSGILLSNSLK